MKWLKVSGLILAMVVLSVIATISISPELSFSSVGERLKSPKILGSPVLVGTPSISGAATFSGAITMSSYLDVSDSLRIGSGQFITELSLTTAAGSLFVVINNTTAATNDTAWLPLN